MGYSLATDGPRFGESELGYDGEIGSWIFDIVSKEETGKLRVGGAMVEACVRG